jgi:hypothetical protein
MSLIICTDPCLYQKDGYCTLSRAVSLGEPKGQMTCVNFLPKPSENSVERLSDISDFNQL